MTILHLATWFPSEKNSVSGLFIKKHIEAIGRLDENYKQIVIPLENQFVSFLNFKKIKSLFNRKKKVHVSNEHFYQLHELELLVSHRFIMGDTGDQLFYQVLKYIEKEKLNIDFIHAHVSYSAGYVALKLSQKLGIPFFITEHMGPFPFTNMLRQPFLNEKIIAPLNAASGISAVSTHLKNSIISIAGNADKITVIPNIVEHQIALQKNNNRKKLQFILIAFLTEVKGVDILIQAVEFLKNKGIDNFHVTIGGDGPLLNKLKKMSMDLEVSEFFSWAGGIKHDEVLNLINAADVYICSSRHESFGVAIVEAMTLGKPILTTDCGGPRDTVNEQNGLIVSKENPLDLAHGIEKMLNLFPSFDSKLISNLSREKYSAKYIGNQLIDWYNRSFKIIE